MKQRLLQVGLIFLLSLSLSSVSFAFDFHCGKNHAKEDINHLVHIKETHDDWLKNKAGDIIGLQIKVILFFQDYTDARGSWEHVLVCKDVAALNKFSKRLRRAYETQER